MTLRDALQTLSPRERQVLKLRCQGHTTRETAEKLFLEEQTVKNYMLHTYRKMAGAVPTMRGRTRAGTGYALCYALGGLICHDHDH